MKTHELAKSLSILAKILRSGPNVELNELTIQKISRSPEKSIDLPETLHNLVLLNKVDKSDWISLINDFGFEIEVRPRDANRDIINKLLRYLQANPEERNRLVSKRTEKESSSSSELANALSILMKK